MSSSGRRPAGAVGDLLRVPLGPVDLRAQDARATPGFTGDKEDARLALADLSQRLGEMQERLFAAGVTGQQRAVLLVLQGMDTAGKGGTLRNVVGMLDPQGVSIAAFKRPTEAERSHDFLWRIRRQLPPAGHVGVFDRSHYEDVLVARVHNLVPPATWERRYEQINAFEAELVAAGTSIVKVLLHIDADEQRERLLERLDNPSKHWKFDVGDLDERLHWREYQAAYEAALERCATPDAPWHIVPAARKWYRNWAVAHLLLEALEAMDLRWPDPGLDVASLRRRLLTEKPT